MAFMFKGPAALTNGSTITAGGTSTFTTGTVTIASAVLTTADVNGGTVDNVVIGGTTAAAGTFTTIAASGNVTLSTGDLILQDASKKIHLQAGSGLQFAASTELDSVTVGGQDNNIIATKGYVDDAVASVGSGLTATTVTASSAAFTVPTLTGNRHFRFNASGYTNTSTTNMTCDFTGASPSDDATYKLSWHAQSGTNPAGYISVDFGAGKILDAAGTAVRYIRLSNIGSAIKLHYSTVGSLNKWLIIGGSGAMPTDTAPS